VIRRGALVLNGQRADITQAAAQCDVTLAESSASFTPAGGSGRVDVRASSAMCAWTAVSDSPWIQIRSGADGRGNTSVTFDVLATTGPPRSGSLTIAGQRFSVTQSEGCTYAIAPAAHSAPAAGSSGTILVTTTAACPWTAASNVPWITVTPPVDSGPGPVSFTVAPTGGPARTGTAVVAGSLFTVTQSAGCSYRVQPLAHSLPSSGGSATVEVDADAGCVWAASSDTPWLTIQGQTSGSGDGRITFSAAASTGPSRTGALTVAGLNVTVTQAQGCTYSISPTQESVAASGGSARVTVTAGSGCAWTAASDVSWIAIQSGSSGSGNGTVNYTVAATSGPGRSGTLTVAGQRVTVNQGQGCTYTINPTQESVPSSGGSGRVTVAAADGCGWTASSNVSWLAIPSGTSGSGNGTVNYTAASTNGPARSGTLTVAGHTFTVNQGQGCTFAIAPTSAAVPDAGGQTSFDVQTSDGCGWTASSNASWIAVTSGASGNGSGPVQLTVSANTGPSRSGTVTAAGQTFTVNQGSGCSFALSASNQSVPAAGGNGTVRVTAPDGCGWTAESRDSWLSITGGASGTGSDNVAFAASANSGPARSGTLTIAGQTFTVMQGESCTFAIAPEQQAVNAAGGSVTVNVTGTAGCSWTSTAGPSWISITSGATGTGSGPVQLSIAANDGEARTGTATIAGRTFTVNQASGCTYTAAPETITSPAGGGAERVDITTASACAWTASSNASWIAVSSGASGRGNGRVDLTIAENTGPARSATVTAANRTIVVNQASGCTFAINPSSTTIPADGGSGFFDVKTANGCTWTATADAAWIVFTAGSDTGSGDGIVRFTVGARGTEPARTGRITVGGQTFTVSQQ
jgi:hypothetical protein